LAGTATDENPEDHRTGYRDVNRSTSVQTRRFFEHHGLKSDPFIQDDAKEDLVFRRGCADHMFHPLWAKIYGHPEEPSTAVVLGERGSGKTALALQIIEQLEQYNCSRPDCRVLVLDYHDFNSFLDEFTRGGKQHLADWELRDHMDAVLSLGVRKLVDLIVEGECGAEEIGPKHLEQLDLQQRRDVLLLATIYDRSEKITRTHRCQSLARALRYRLRWWLLPWLFLLWPPYLRRWFSTRRLAQEIASQIRVLPHDSVEFRKLLLRFGRQDLAKQPVNGFADSDTRYKLLTKLINVGKSLGFAGAIVVVDRVDEPVRIKGDPQRMFELMRSIFDLKFLKHDHLGIKLLLPADLYQPIQKHLDGKLARLDKQNFVRSLQWQAASLHDLINARLDACSTASESKVTLRQLLDEGVSDADIMNWLERLRIPRHAFKFMHELIAAHCQSHTDEHPSYKVNRDSFVECRADFSRSLEEYENEMPVS
jgi:hypothetical protein